MIKHHKTSDIFFIGSGSSVVIAGWLESSYQSNNWSVIELRDQWGRVKILIKDRELIHKIKDIKIESVIQIKGKKITAEEGLDDQDFALILGDEVNLINSAKNLPFSLKDASITSIEEQNFRYLALRKQNFQRNLRAVSKTKRIIREFLEQRGYIDIDLRKEYYDFYNLPYDNKYLVPSCLTVFPLFDELPTTFRKCFQFVRAPIEKEIPLPYGIEGTWLNLGISDCKSLNIAISLVNELVQHIVDRYDELSYKGNKTATFGSSSFTGNNDVGKLLTSKLHWSCNERIFEKFGGNWKARFYPFVAPIINFDKERHLIDSPKEILGEVCSILSDPYSLGFVYKRNTNQAFFDFASQVIKIDAKTLHLLEPVINDAIVNGINLCGIEFQIERLTAILIGEEDITNMFAFP